MANYFCVKSFFFTTYPLAS